MGRTHLIGRRDFLAGSLLSLVAATPPAGAGDPAYAPGVARRRAPAPTRAGVVRFGAAEPFDYARLKGMARERGAAAYRRSGTALPDQIKALDWDHWQAIQYRPEHALWAGEGLRFQLRFAHLGFRLERSVRMFEVESGQAREILYDPAMFDYASSGLKPREIPADLGFGGVRLFFHTDWTRDIVAFQGASYFRAVDVDRQYGLSQRGLAIDCGLPEPEEFPDFVAFWLERPAADADRLTVYALLDSESLAGAYRFVIEAGEPLVMDIDAALYPRRSVRRLGIAPGTSMFLVGKSSRRVAEDWRPEIHDSDGLEMLTGRGESIWRPLVNPAQLRVSSFLDESPRGFGLMQRERRFEQYQDDGVFYEKRPDAWVEPRGNWGKGAVMLVEIPTGDETADNIVAFWSPEQSPQPGQEYLTAYRLYWCRDNPLRVDVARVKATRTGIGGVVGQPRRYFSWRFVIDFAGGALPTLRSNAPVKAVITASRGRVEIVSARPLPEEGAWRAMFDLVPDAGTEPIDLRLYLALAGQALSETWVFQYTPPPPAERRTG